MKTEITKELLLADGWLISEEPGILMNKPIENQNPINDDPDDTGIELVIHLMFNSQNFAIVMPDGGMLNFVANSMEELKAFESAITFYDCPY